MQSGALTAEKIRAIIKEIDEQVALALKQREHLVALLRLQGKPLGGAAKRSTLRGAPMLKDVIVSILSKEKKPVKPGALRDKILNSGYETRSNRRTFYTNVFQTAARLPGVKKTKEGFSLENTADSEEKGESLSSSEESSGKKKKAARAKKKRMKKKLGARKARRKSG